jgi:hypothetical protein
MGQHAFRATPWLLLGCAAAVVTLLLRIVEEWPYQMWPLQGVAVGLLAATAAWPLDEPAAAVVDTLPRGLGWRTLARCVGIALLLAGWLGAVSWTRTAYFGHAVDVAWQGVAAVLVSIAAATWLRRRGVATPAGLVATVAIATALYLALARPAEELLPLLPYTAAGPWGASRMWWTALAVSSLIVLWIALAEAGLSSRARSTSRPPSARASRLR